MSGFQLLDLRINLFFRGNQFIQWAGHFSAIGMNIALRPDNTALVFAVGHDQIMPIPAFPASRNQPDIIHLKSQAVCGLNSFHTAAWTLAMCRQINQSGFQERDWLRQISQLAIKVASPETILRASGGEVENDDTFANRTLKPMDHGLFCERVFGPIWDWRCPCGKINGNKKPELRGTVCPNCGVKILSSNARRERIGHINLAVPVAHIFFWSKTPAIGLCLGLSDKELETIIYFNGWLVTDPKGTPLDRGQVLPITPDEDQPDVLTYYQAGEKYGLGTFEAKMGAEAVREALCALDLESEINSTRQAMLQTANRKTIKKSSRRLRLLQALATGGIRPEWMVLTVLPVLPAGLRPPVFFGGSGKYQSNVESRSPEVKAAYAALSNLLPRDYPKKPALYDPIGISDLNELYSGVIRQNNRLKALLQRPDSAEGLDMQLEKCKLQEAVDALLLKPSARQSRDNPVSLLNKIEAVDDNDLKAKNKLRKLIVSIQDTYLEMTDEQKKEILGLDEKLKQPQADVVLAKNSLRDMVRRTAGDGVQLRQRNFKPLKSISDGLTSKAGSFRENLLGKRVDYSGRSVIVVGPELKLHQCGLPKPMALVLFEPFFKRRFRELFGRDYSKVEFNNWIINPPSEICDILAEVLQRRLVLLNRAPTLHRLSIQAFKPVLVEGLAIHLHPLTCPAYNADFDGDQMAVHVPLSKKALKESCRRMLATKNILSPASGKPIVTPSQDIVLGCYYLTLEPRQSPPIFLNKLPLFGSLDEALMVFGYWSVKKLGQRLKMHDWIRLANPDFGRTTIFGDAGKKFITTTVGRILFNEIWPAELGFVNKPVKKADLGDLILACYKTAGPKRTVALLDKLKDVGFQAATRAGISIGIADMLIPVGKEQVIAAAQTRVDKIKNYHKKDVITDNEKRKGIHGVWRQCTNEVTSLVEGALKNHKPQDRPNPLWLMLNSGARGSRQQIVQLTGMRGLMVKANGEIMENPILANFREGLTVSEFFSSCHGARKGTIDTALKTASAGYLTRKLVAAVTDVVITTSDCGTRQSRDLVFARQDTESPDEFSKRMGFMLIGQVAAEAINSPLGSNNVLVTAGQEIDEAAVKILGQNTEVRARIRSVLTCECVRGVCAQCYGRDLATGNLVKPGFAAGIIAAQSISEPGTQLTMRTFHTGGVASDKGDITGGLPGVNAIFEATRPNAKAVFTKIGGVISFEKNDDGKPLLMITNTSGEREGHKIPRKTRRIVHEGDTMLPGQRLTEGTVDPHDFMSAFGPLKFMERLVDEVQKIFQIQDVSIHRKHFEIIARQMTSCVSITEPGDTGFVLGEVMNRAMCLEKNARVVSKGGQPAEVAPVLLGITRAALRSESFLSAASFQFTTKILAEAAVLSNRDPMLGLKACVMTGKLIPAGTGFNPDITSD
jgi:DNA-directed RNA polymerase subunit beta'